MAPSRRKNANKAAAAAAAPRKWKVGDLVLAKVKGFPAWPATVSEPEKWGYSADWRKVVVQFFGCDQIAFCNPADVEEFTEEKKVSLIGKRHGKGADFVRAVNEIIDCFEKLKKQDQVSRANGTEGTNITSENTEGSLNESVKDEDLVVKPSAGTANDLNSLTEAAIAAAAEDALHDNEMLLVAAPSNLVSSVEPATSTYMRRNKTGVALSQKSGSLRRTSARLLRSSSRIDASKLQSLIPSTINTRSSRWLSANVSEGRSLRRSKRIVKSSDDSVGDDVDSLAIVSNGSIEESDSEILTVDSDSLSVNDGAAIDSGKSVESVEPLAENNEREAKLSYRLDFQSSNVIIKKKRKPNRKRNNSDTVEAAKHDLGASDVEILKAECVSPTSSDKSTQRCVKDDGDEHLPLVKRARVRMGRPSPAAKDEVTLMHKEEKMLEVPKSLAAQSVKPLSCNVDAPSGRESVPIIEDPSFSSLSHGSPVKKPTLCETRKNLVDEEAALPPSKRLHRALEAMSANVAEDCERGSICSPAANIQSNGHIPSFTESSELPMGKKAVIELESGATEDLRNGDSLSNSSEFCILSDVTTLEYDSKNVTVVSDCVKIHNNDRMDPELCRDPSECAEGADNKCPKLPLSNEVPAEIEAEHCVKPESLSVGEHLAHLNCNIACMTISSSDHYKTEHLELNEVAEKCDDPNVEETITFSPSNDTCINLDSANGEGDETQHLVLAENDRDSKRYEIVEEASSVSLESNTILSVTHVKVLDGGHQRYPLHSAAISNDHIADRNISITKSSTSQADRPDSVARASPLSSSICNVSVINNNISLENHISSSPDVQLHLEKAKIAGRSISKEESLSSFEAIIRSLTRTKESIGRATRIAIDCAKLGFASKVVEILACNLESESSLHKKVDLFFLVDSITQCSRGIKGDGGVYPSAIQAVLPRLLLAAAPSGSNSHENHRQCLKVLRVWQERKILPEPIIRHHIRELDSLCGSYPIIGSQRPLRNERAFDDPIREMEGVLVDEYGSNSSIQLPGFCMPPMLKDDDGGSDSDGESFEAVTPEHNVENHDGEKSLISAVEKRSHILEDVDGELEMEDVAPCCEAETTSTSNIAGPDHTVPNHQSDNQYGSQLLPQQPKDVAPTSAALSRSPLPPPPPPHAPPLHQLAGSAFTHGVHNSISNGRDSKPYSSCQNFNRNFQDINADQSDLPRLKPTAFDTIHRHVCENKDFEAQVPRPMLDSSNACAFSDQPTCHLPSRASNNDHRTDAFGKGFHVRPPHPAPSNQFSYVQEHRIHSRRDIPPPSNSNRFHARNSENGNFYRDRGRNKFIPRDNIGECWRPSFPSVSGPCYPDDSRMAHGPMPYSGPPHEPPLPNNRWNFPPVPMNHRHFNYRPPSEGPVPVTNRGYNYWRP